MGTVTGAEVPRSGMVPLVSTGIVCFNKKKKKSEYTINPLKYVLNWRKPLFTEDRPGILALRHGFDIQIASLIAPAWQRAFIPVLWMYKEAEQEKERNSHRREKSLKGEKEKE